SAFFFQAEDGIRDYKVTGVQTCALPILPSTGWPDAWCSAGSRAGTPPKERLDVPAWTETDHGERCANPLHDHRAERPRAAGGGRSEERRVGKEGRCRRRPEH